MRKSHDPAKAELALALLSWALLIGLILAIGGMFAKNAFAATLLYDSGAGNNSYVYFNSAADKAKYTLACSDIGAEGYEIESIGVRLYGNTGAAGSVDLSIGGTATDTINVPSGGYTWFYASTSYACLTGQNVSFHMKANDANEQLWSADSTGSVLGTITQYGTTDSGSLKYLTLKVWGIATSTGGGGGGGTTATTSEQQILNDIMLSGLWLVAFISGFIFWVYYLRS